MNARHLAIQVLLEWESKGLDPGDELDSLLLRSHLKGPDRGLATELVYGVVRRRDTLDWVLKPYCHQQFSLLPRPIQMILRQAVYQMIYLDRIPVSAAVNEAVRLAHRYGHTGLAQVTNGILRAFGRSLERFNLPQGKTQFDYAVRQSLPDWLAERWFDRYGPEEAEHLADALNEPAPLHMRTNLLKISRDNLMETLSAAGREPQALDLPEAIALRQGGQIGLIPGYEDGLWYVQDLGSQAVAHALSPKPGDLVYDFCAAPGGKTTHLAQLMGDIGRIIAIDDHSERLSKLWQNVLRLGLKSIEAEIGDARKMVFPDQADAILVDAPCSGLGVLRRKPDIRWARTPEEIAELSNLQGEILAAAAQWLRPGGRLVYSTCTMEPEENEDVVEAFLAEHPGFVAEDLRDRLPAAWFEGNKNPAFLQLLPHRHGTDGFFIASMIRYA